jgi:serine/threonine-protein phosphatase PP1 catalytic subunit
MGPGLSKSERRTVEKCYSALLSWSGSAEAPHFRFDRQDLTMIIDRAKAALLDDPTLLSLTAPISVVGDIHGKLGDLQAVFRLAGAPSGARYLFLGDYVDRGPNSLECICLLLCAKLLFPADVFLLRGNHESADMCELGGFGAECLGLYDPLLFLEFMTVFDVLPIAAVLNGRVFCVHGGISESFTSLANLRKMKRPLAVLESPLLTDLLWADPSSNCGGWQPSSRGASQTYGRDAVAAFFAKTGLTMICRAHEVAPDGVHFPFAPDHSVVTIFSCSNYNGQLGNLGAVLLFDVNLDWSCKFIAPVAYQGVLPGPKGEREKTPEPVMAESEESVQTGF